MFSILCLCLFVISVCAEESISTNSTNPLFDDRIIDGHPTNIADYPYQVALIKNHYFWCGGSLIKWNWIITAGHCSHGEKPKSMNVRAGSKYWNKGGVFAKVKKIIVHPKFSIQTLTHDCALWRTDGSFQKFSKTYSISLIGLATSVPFPKENVELAGWGQVSTTSAGVPIRLQAVTMHTISRTLCASTTQIDSSMFCAGNWNGGADSCYGDSGGGLKYGKNLIGIVSFGTKGCGLKHHPTIYCSVPSIRTWALATAK